MSGHVTNAWAAYVPCCPGSWKALPSHGQIFNSSGTDPQRSVNLGTRSPKSFCNFCKVFLHNQAFCGPHKWMPLQCGFLLLGERGCCRKKHLTQTYFFLQRPASSFCKESALQDKRQISDYPVCPHIVRGKQSPMGISFVKFKTE